MLLCRYLFIWPFFVMNMNIVIFFRMFILRNFYCRNRKFMIIFNSLALSASCIIKAPNFSILHSITQHEHAFNPLLPDHGFKVLLSRFKRSLGNNETIWLIYGNFVSIDVVRLNEFGFIFIVKDNSTMLVWLLFNLHIDCSGYLFFLF